MFSEAAVGGVFYCTFAPAVPRMNSQITGICIIFSLVPSGNNAESKLKNVCNCLYLYTAESMESFLCLLKKQKYAILNPVI